MNANWHKHLAHLASRQRREVCGLEQPAHDWIKPGTHEDARYSLGQAHRTPGRGPATV